LVATAHVPGPAHARVADGQAAWGGLRQGGREGVARRAWTPATQGLCQPRPRRSGSPAAPGWRS